jgi:RimJ/RimL family protein N-acetyltransferase
MEASPTSRLTATKLASADLRDLVELHLDPDVSRFLGRVRTPEATAAHLETNLRHWADHDVGLWTLRMDDGTFVAARACATSRWRVSELKADASARARFVAKLWVVSGAYRHRRFSSKLMA